ncbi:MAG: rhomboid family intramembrane serine protease [Nanoarchaeota archaeon]|nr:rhomboid family intramembrane serine protease [Nanoarchaeota archaeon]
MDYAEYYVRRQPEKPVFNIGSVTKWLIIICVASFVAIFFISEDTLLYYFTYNSETVLQNPWTLITNVFVHGDLFHLLFNCFALFMFGSLVELRHGSKFTLVLFFSSVILANIVFGFFNPGIYGLGISGYVYALIGAAVILDPQVRVLFPIGFFYTTAPVSIAGPILFITELVFSIGSTDGVGHVAHAAGFIAGILIGYVQKKRSPPVIEKIIRY